MGEAADDMYDDAMRLLEEEEPGFSIPDVVCLSATDNAILIESKHIAIQTWVPKSQLRAYNEVSAPGDEGLLVVSSWLAEQRGWGHE